MIKAAFVFLLASSLGAQVQIGKNVQLGAATPGGAGNPSAPTSSIQFNNSGSFGGTTKAVTDAAGNLQLPSLNGMLDAYMSQTTPTSNNGIFNALQVQNTNVVAGPNYPITEFQSYTAGPRGPMFDTGFAGFPAPGTAAGTILYDMRPITGGWMDHNVLPASIFPPMHLFTVFQDDNPDGYDGYNPWAYQYKRQCCGMQSNGFSQQASQWLTYTMQDQVGGINGAISIEDTKFGPGDVHALQLILNNNGNTNTESDEGGAGIREVVQVQNAAYQATVNTTAAPGTNLISATPVSGSSSIFPGEDKLLSDVSVSLGGCLASAFTTGGFPTPNTFTCPNLTFTPDLKCAITQNVNVNGHIKGGTTSATFTIGSCINTVSGQAFPLANNANFPACIVSRENIQSVKVTASSSSSVTAALYISVDNGGWLYQGPQACSSGDLLANSFNTYAHITRVLGCPSAHACDNVSIGGGQWTTPFNASFSLSNLPSGVTMVRDGAGHVSVNLGFQDTTGFFLNAKFTVTSTNGTFAGLHQVLTDDGANPTTITWADAGGAATATTNANDYFLAANGQVANSIVIFPATTIVQAENPTTKQVDGTIVVQEHGWPATAGHSLYSGAGDQLSNTLIHGTSQDIVPSATNAAGIFWEGQVIDPGPGRSIFRVQLEDNNGITSPTDFIGDGGTKPPSLIVMDIAGAPIVNDYFDFSAPHGAFLRINDCGIFPCTSPFSAYTIMSLTSFGGTGSFLQQFHPNVDSLDTTFGGGEFLLSPSVNRIRAGGSTYFTDVEVGNAGFIASTVGSGSANGVLSVLPFEIVQAMLVSGSPVNTTTMTTVATVFDHPVIAPSGQFGAPTTYAVLNAAIPCSGTTVGTIAAITDPSTLTWGANVTGGGGGGTYAVVTCNGSNYTVVGK